MLVPRCAGLRLVPIAWSGEKVRESSRCCLCGTVVRLKCNSFGLQGVASKSVSPNGNFGIKRNEPLDIFSIMGLDFHPNDVCSFSFLPIVNTTLSDVLQSSSTWLGDWMLERSL